MLGEINLPVFVTACIIADEIRLRVYSDGSVKIEVPLRRRQALGLAAQLLNQALLPEYHDPLMLDPAEQHRVTRESSHMADDVCPGCNPIKVDSLTDRPGAVYQLTFMVMADEISPILRLKALMKRAGRDLGFKCVSVRDPSVGR
jgi:hypothetical protein